MNKKHKYLRSLIEQVLQARTGLYRYMDHWDTCKLEPDPRDERSLITKKV